MFAVIDLSTKEIVQTYETITHALLEGQRNLGRDVYPIRQVNQIGSENSGGVLKDHIDTHDRTVWRKWFEDETAAGMDSVMSEALHHFSDRLNLLETKIANKLPDHATFNYRQTPSNGTFLLGIGSWDANLGLVPFEAACILGLTGFIEPKPSSGTLELQVMINGNPQGELAIITAATGYRLEHTFAAPIRFDKNTVESPVTVSLQGKSVNLKPRSRPELTVMMWLKEAV